MFGLARRQVHFRYPVSGLAGDLYTLMSLVRSAASRVVAVRVLVCLLMVLLQRCRPRYGVIGGALGKVFPVALVVLRACRFAGR